MTMKAIAAQPRPFHPTPAWLGFGLLASTGILLLSQRFQWFAFNHHKGWTLLVAVAAVGVAVVLMLTRLAVAVLFRWRFRLGLRPLLALAAAVTVLCFWLAWEMRESREQRHIVAEIEGLGGQVDDDLTWYSGRRYHEEAPEPQWIRSLLGDDFFRQAVPVYYGGTAMNDERLAKLPDTR